MDNVDHTAGIGHRYEQLRAHFGLSKEALGAKSGVSGTTIGNIEAGKHTPKADAVAAIARNLGVGVEWLLFGEGPMVAGAPKNADGTVLLIDEPEPYQHPKALQAAGHLLARAGGGVPMVTVDSDGRENIAMVSTMAEASYPTRYLEPEFYHQLPVFSIPLPQFRNATFRAFQVTGDSMSPTFYAGGWVLTRYVDFARETLQEGYIHVVVTQESVVVKRVLDRVAQRGTLALQSDNEEFQSYEVPIEEVQEVWRVVADIGFKFPNTRFDTRRRVAGVEADLQNVLARLEKIEKLNKAG